ncbi:MAG TPA: RNase adapter RapZ, partial [Nitriliruptorales bacterium]
LQKEGANLDERTKGRWLLHYVQRELERSARLVVDSGRTRRQVEPILEEIVESRLVFLNASDEARRHRYHVAARSDPLKRNVSFVEAMDHDTERRATDLKSMAHVIVDTDGLGPEVVLREVEARLGLERDEHQGDDGLEQ